MSNGHNQPEEKQRKQCPYTQEPCIAKECQLWVELTQAVMGLTKKIGMCTHVATSHVMVEFNNKLAKAQEKKMMHLPHYKG